MKVRAPGTCGELVQGIMNRQNFLITCPVDIYSDVILVTGSALIRDDHPKARQAVERTLQYLGHDTKNCQIIIHSGMPVGKGMASSSADISAACQVAAIYAEKDITPGEIADIALAIEPTDAVFYPGIMMFDHVEGKLRRFLGQPPPMDIIILDAGGEVDTMAFNKRDDLPRLNKAKEKAVRKAAKLVIAGIEKGNCRLIGEGATISAIANQAILYKPCLDTVISISSRYGAVGVNVAHSGTVLGVLFPAGQGQKDECLADILRHCDKVQFIRIARLIPGGLIIEEGDDLLRR